jgi:hypothetical protein
MKRDLDNISKSKEKMMMKEMQLLKENADLKNQLLNLQKTPNNISASKNDQELEHRIQELERQLRQEMLSKSELISQLDELQKRYATEKQVIYFNFEF